jgi:HSP20 family protein
MEKEGQDANDVRIESFYGTFSRGFLLPDNIDASGIHAESKDGVVRVHVPKTASSQPRPISIEVK